MQKTIVIVAFAVSFLTLPQLASAHSSRRSQPSAPMQASRAGFVHRWNVGRARPKQIQSRGAEKIPGAPNGMLVEMLERHPLSARNASLPPSQTLSGPITHGKTAANLGRHVAKQNTYSRMEPWNSADLGG